MVSGSSQTNRPRPLSARFFLWTIRKQDRIAYWLALNMWSAVSALLAMALVGLQTLEMALWIILVGAIAVGSILWMLIERRRFWLLAISDAKLKAEAHQAMIDYLRAKLRPTRISQADELQRRSPGCLKETCR
jgi:hypothetical protein